MQTCAAFENRVRQMSACPTIAALVYYTGGGDGSVACRKLFRTDLGQISPTVNTIVKSYRVRPQRSSASSRRLAPSKLPGLGRRNAVELR